MYIENPLFEFPVPKGYSVIKNHVPADDTGNVHGVDEAWTGVLHLLCPPLILLIFKVSPRCDALFSLGSCRANKVNYIDIYLNLVDYSQVYLAR